jgi:16S rRNA processing protein RimM
MVDACSSTSGTPTGAADAAGPGVPAWDDLILVGIVARTQGNRGEVIVNPHTDFPDERFRPGAGLWLRRPDGAPERVTVDRMRMHLGRPVIGFAGVGSISEAEAFTNAELRIAPEEQQALPEGSYYHHQLIGCRVELQDGTPVGTVTGVDGEGGAVRLVVKRPRAEVLIPLADDICPLVDVAARRIVVMPPAGLLEVNGDWRAEGAEP